MLSVETRGRPHVAVGTPQTDVSGVPPRDAALLQVDDYLGVSPGTEFAPAGDVGQVTTSSTTTQEIARYDVPMNKSAVLTEVSLLLDANGTGRIQLSGETYGDLSGSVSVTLPWEGAKLSGGDSVVIKGESTAGSETVLRGSIVALEV